MKAFLLSLVLAIPAYVHAQTPAVAGAAPKQKVSARLEVKAAVAGSKSDRYYYYSLRDKGQNIGFTGTVTSLAREPFKAKAQWWIMAKDATKGRVVHDSGEEEVTVVATKPGIFMFGGVFESVSYRGGAGNRLFSGRKFDGWAARVLGPNGELLDAAGSNEELKKIAASDKPFPEHKPQPKP